MIVQNCRCCSKFLFEPKEVTYQLLNLILEEPMPKETMNIQVIGDFINSLKRVETQNFDIGRTKRKWLKLKGFLSYDFELESIFKFLLVFMVCSLMQYEYMMSCTMHMRDHDKCRPYMFLTKRKVWQYIRHTYSRWRIALIHIVSSSGMTYANVVSVPAEEHNRNIWHTSPLIP
jgi:hypothetical protein